MKVSQSLFLAFLMVTLISCKGGGGGGESGGGASGSSSNTATPSFKIKTPSSYYSNDDTPTFEVTSISSGYTVQVYDDSSCTNQIYSGTSTGASHEITLSSMSEGSYNFYATVKNASGESVLNCKEAPESYTLDQTLPSKATSISFVSPSSNSGTTTNIQIQASDAEASSTVKVYSDSSCSSLLAEGSAGSNISVSNLSRGGTTIYFEVLDQAGNSSGCSNLVDTYTADITPVAPSSITTATNPSNDTTPDVTVNNTLSGDTVYFYSDSNCSTQIGSGAGSNTNSTITMSALSEGTITIYSKVVSSTAKVSPCSSVKLDYVLDTTGPSIAITSPSSDNQVFANNTLAISGTCDNSYSVSLSYGSNVTGDATTTCSSGTFSTNVTISGTTGSRSITASQQDAAGNTTSVTRVVDIEINGSWTPINTTGAPSSRESDSTSVAWTDTNKMLVFGGCKACWASVTHPDYQMYLDGGLYDPVTDTWSSITDAPTPSSGYYKIAYANTVWTGDSLLVLGGRNGNDSCHTLLSLCYNEFFMKYVPSTDTWSYLTNPFSNSVNLYSYSFTDAKVVWTGLYMFIWGGKTAFTSFMRFASLYDPATNNWYNVDNSSSRPRADFYSTAETDGAKVYIWGQSGDSYTKYFDIATNSWGNISDTNGPTTADSNNHKSVFYNGKMYVLSSDNSNVLDLKAYDTATNSWSTLSTTNGPTDLRSGYNRYSFDIKLGGTKIYVWNSISNKGYYYDIVANSWHRMSEVSAPSSTSYSSPKMVWTGTQLIVYIGGTEVGAVYTP